MSKKTLKTKTKIFSRIVVLLRTFFIFMIVFAWMFSGWSQILNFPPKVQEVYAAVPTFQQAGGVTSGAKTITPAMPGAGLVVTDDIILLSCETANEAVTVSGGTETWTEIPDSPQGTGTAGSTGATRLTVFWARASQNDPTSPTTNDPGNHIICRITTYRGIVTSGDPFDVTAGGVEVTADTSVAIPGDTTTVDDTLIVAIVAADLNDQNNTSQYSSFANSDLTNVTERTDNAKNSGNGGSLGIGTGELVSFGTYGDTTATHVSSVVKGMISIALKPSLVATTTIGDGTDPSNSTVAPESGIIDLDAFTFIADTGTDSVTALTVTLGSGDAANLSEVRVTNDDGSTLYFSAISTPGSDTLNFSGGTPIPVITSSVQFKVRITPETHVNMPGPNGAEYAITGTVTSFTSTNSQAGTDTDSATITIDNLSPNDATSTSGSVTSDTEITINWTTSNSTDYNRSLVLRWQASTPGSDVPAEGTDYVLDNTIGAATVACLETTGTSSTAYSGVDGSGADECSSTALTAGTQYSYKHFEKDDNGNWNTGVTNSSSPLTTTGGATLTFSISDNDIFFGELNTSSSKWADNTSDGSTSAVVAHTLIANTSATNGYTITVNGSTLTSGGDSIDAMSSEVTLSTGTEQFGLRITASGGDGSVDAIYDNTPADTYALITADFPDVIASDANGNNVSTTYSLYYAANITTTTEAHTDYTSTLTYIATGNF